MPADHRVGRARLSESARASALASLLATHPDAWAGAISPSGGRFVDMPAEVPLKGHRVIAGAVSGLEFVVSEERSQVIDTFARAVADGAGNATLHRSDAPHKEMSLYVVDMTERYGVYIGVFLGFGTDEAPMAAPRPDLVPRMTVLRKDQVGVITRVDEAATAILGWRPEELLGRRTLEFMHPDDHDLAIANWLDMIARPGSAQRVRVRHQHKDGSWVWLEITNHNRLDDADDPHVLSDMIDVTEEVIALQALRTNERLLRQITEAMPIGVLKVRADGGVDYGNERLATLVGVGRAANVAEQFAHAVNRDREVLLDAIAAALGDGRDRDVKVAFGPRPGADRAEATVHCDIRVPEPVKISWTPSCQLFCSGAGSLGGLIHATVGSLGGSGRWLNRSGLRA